jgi:antitoxin PrlF
LRPTTKEDALAEKPERRKKQASPQGISKASRRKGRGNRVTRWGYVESGVVIEEVSTLTDKYQTTVPEPIRRVLGVNKRDQLAYRVSPRGDVILVKRSKEEEHADPVVARFLNLLERDIAEHRENVRPATDALLEHALALTAGVEYDINAPLEDD